MEETKNFKTEYQAFLQQYPYRTIEVNGTKIRYQYGGKEGAPVLLFFRGLEMQETWMPYALHFGQNYRFLIYEYPLHITNVDEQMAFTFALLKVLAIRQVILIGCSDGGVHAQIFAKNYPEVVTKMILITTLTLDSDYLRHIKKAWFVTPLLLLFLKLIPAKTEMNLLLKKCQGFLTCESPEGQAYGRTFYETVTSNLCYKQRYIHSVKCVSLLKDYPVFDPADFAYLRGKIQVLIPENDIFTKEDQARLSALFEKLDAEILRAPGGHMGFVVQAEDYMEKIEKFLARQ